jgi:hypothetical protein
MIGGVGQRMLAGVAKKLAGEFFADVDAVLTGTAASPAGEVSVASDRPAVYRAPEAPGKKIGIPAGQPISFILGAVFGAAAALAGVLVGVRVARGGGRQ